jgi:mRNA-degrading endonuclease RelE of RelBE toxin-antitoxin system
MTWGFLIADRAKRQLRRFSAEEREYIDLVFEEMCADPYADDVKFLKGTSRGLSRRVGTWRIVYEVEPKRHIIAIVSVERRSSNTY